VLFIIVSFLAVIRLSCNHMLLRGHHAVELAEGRVLSAGSYAYILVTVATPPHLDHRRLL
jgi:hypothetical protein